MIDEKELADLHGRITRVIGYASRQKISAKAIEPLLRAKVFLEWVLETQSRPATEYAVALFKCLQNIEGLQRADEQSQKGAIQ